MAGAVSISLRAPRFDGADDQEPMSSLMVTVEVSQWLVEPTTALLSVGVNVARQEIVLSVDVLITTNVVVLLVLALPLASTGRFGNVARTFASAVPGVHVAFLYSVNVTVPAAAAPLPVVTWAESFGSQFWVVEMADVSCTVKHSFVPFAPPNSAYGPAVKLLSPGHSARKQ
jgi:hypothetical protein